MKTFYPRTALTALALATAITISPAQLQTQATQQPPDSVVAVVADALGLPFVRPDQRPFFGAFWGVRSSLPCITPPMPCPPLDPNTPVYAIGDPVAGGQFLVDETAGQVISPHTQSSGRPPSLQVISPHTQSSRRLLSTMDSAATVQAQVDELQNFIAQTQARQAEALLRANGQMDALALDGQDGGGVFGPMGLDSYTASDFWLSISQITNGVAPLVIHGTLQDLTYEILSRQTLTDTIWTSETNVQGAADQDWTPTTVVVGSRTNALFLWCRSWVSSNGSGIPDWWLLQYFGSTDIDPHALCPSGDGWTILQAYQNGWNPTNFYTPPPPQNVAAVLDSSGASATITWASGGGPVTNYAIYGGVNLGQVSSSTFSFADSWGSPPYDFVPDWTYTVRAYFANGAYADSQPARITAARLSSSMAAVRGPAGRLYLVIGSVPSDLSIVQVYWWDDTAWPGVLRSIDLNAAAFVNGIAPLPLDQMTGYMLPRWLDAQCIATNGNRGAVAEFYPYPRTGGEKGSSGAAAWNFVDARPHVKENLKFLLRSATANLPFSYASNLKTDGSVNIDVYPSSVRFPEAYYARAASPAGYEYYGFHVFSTNLNYSVMQELKPVQEHYLWRNFVFDPLDYDLAGAITCDYDCPPTGIRCLWNPLHQYPGSGTETNPALAFTAAGATWLYFHGMRSDSCPSLYQAEVGVGTNSNNHFVLGSSAKNGYGLAFNSVKLTDPDFTVLQPGTPSTLLANNGTTFYPQSALPTLETVGYYFASQSWYLNWQYNGWSGSGPLAGPAPPLPGSPTFSVANTSPLLITGFGQPITVSGWAKQAITNGYSGKYAYLEQYFDKAYTQDGNGNVTTNEAGLLSPYGEFFPMQPGPAALVTMADIDTGQRGTGVVNVIKLQTDVDHNGQMDLSFGGPDNTSQARPQLMWVNNDHDEPASGSNPDRDLNDWGNPPPVPLDYSYGQIRCQRNLEDFARLWICGMPTLPTNQAYSVQLAWSQISSGAPRMRLYWASETNGGIGYLTNATIAAQQIAQHNTPIGEISPTSTLTLPANVFSNGVNKYFLYEAGGVGSGQLTLTISQGGTNTIAQTSAWFDFHDITDFCEWGTVTNVLQDWPDMVQTNLTSGFQVLSYAKLNPGDAKQLAVFIHGWRMGAWDWFSFSSTMFKRLWWQGYQGRFAALRWPTRNANTELFPQMGYITYNRSERIAFKSGTGAAAYLNDLRNRFPDYTISGCSHSMGGIVAMETLKELATAGQQPVDNWVLMQAAVPAQCFDTNAPNFQMFLNGEAVVPTPDVYRNYGAGITNALRPGGKIANFFNPDDFALWTWQLNQAFYVANLLGNGVTTMKPNAFFGYSTDGTTSVLSTNVWNQSFYSILYGGYYGSGPTRAVTSPLELMPFVARPRGLAVGASPNVHGQIQGQQLDLENQLGFGAESSDHSGEFNRNIQEPPIWPFYSQLKTNLFVHP